MKASGHSDPPSRKEYIKGQRSTAPTPQQNHAALYLRVSTPDQKPDLQYDGLRAYAERAGLTIVGEYCDIAVSGRREGRPRLNALMTRARNRELDCVLVWKFDRFARSTRHLLTALEEFDHLGVRFIPTGGVTESTIGEWLAIKQVVAVGGTWIAKTEDIREGRFAEIAKNAAGAVKAAREALEKRA